MVLHRTIGPNNCDTRNKSIENSLTLHKDCLLQKPRYVIMTDITRCCTKADLQG